MKSLIHLVICLPLAVLLTVSAAHASNCLSSPRLTGVNIAGAEFNSKRLPGVIFKDYTYPKDSELAYIAAQGANIIRLPFRWERLQPEANKALNADELKRLKNTVNKASAQGLCVLLDVHNYAEYYGESFEEKPALEDAFVDLWKRLADEFTDPTQTIYGLMNEPAHIPVKQWADLAKRTVKTLRDEGATNRIFVGGGSWSGLHDWFKPKGETTNAAEFATLSDPLKRTTIEVHQYADEWYSGTKTDCHPPDHFDPKFERISAWAAEHNQQLFLGEFGMATTEECLQVLERILSLMEGSVWKGWTYWAAGGWWGDYPFALNTNATTPSLQWKPLKDHFYVENPPNPPGPAD